MNKTELIGSMSEKSKLTKKDTELALKALIEIETRIPVSLDMG